MGISDTENGDVDIVTTKADTFIELVKERFANYAEKGKKMISPIADPMLNWASKNSIYPLHFGIACCALEMASGFASRFDAERFGIVARSTPRQSDLLLVNGTVTWKLSDKLITLYEQMPSPKWVLAMGNCAISGGPFRTSYSVVPGVDKLVPVDIYVAGCPPRPENLLNGILKLEELIKKKESIVRSK